MLHGIDLDKNELAPKAQKKLKRMPWFDLTVDSVEVELGWMRLMEGKDVVKSANV